MGLIDDLKKTGTLNGEELDAALLDIKEKYDSPTDRDTIKTYLTGECREIKEELLQVNAELRGVTVKEQLKDKCEILPEIF